MFYSEGSQAASEGKVGAAILAGINYTTAQILLYRNQTEYLCTADISASFTYNVLENNFGSFYDNDRKYWSIQFNNATDARNFAIHVAIAKHMVAGGNDAGAIHQSRGGVRTIAVSLPCRYLHGPMGLIAQSDLHQAQALISSLANTIAGGSEL